MKKILLILLCLPAFATAQIKDTSFAQIDQKFSKASAEMTKFHNQFQSGIMLEIMGGVLLAISPTVNNTNKGTKTGLEVGGGILLLVGFAMNLSSSGHIRNAGLILKGSSLVVPIGKKKPVTIFKN